MRRVSIFFALSLMVAPWLTAMGQGSAKVAAPPAIGQGRVQLTEEERAWIAAHPVIRAGHDATYSPYAMRDGAGEIVGIDPDYLELIGRRTGLKFRNEVRSDWGKIIQEFKGGNVDVLLSLTRTADRESYLTYTRSYVSAPNVIITRNDSPALLTLAELKGRTIGLPRGAMALRRDLDLAVPGNLAVEFATPLECYRAVATGEVYASVGEIANASYLIRTHGWTSLRIGMVLSTSMDLCLGVRKDWPLLGQIINKALDDITPADRAWINNRWVAVDPSMAPRWAKAFKVASIVAAVAIGVFLLVLFHNRSLARELAKRRKIQAELEQTRDRLVRASQEKSELMHMVAHDLRGPLTAIQLGVELLQMEPALIPALRATTTRRVNESADQMARLISDLLSTQNVEEGRFALKYAAGDALHLARAAVTSLATVAQHKHIVIEAHLPGEPVAITTDFVALQQVVDNLLSNALKYSPVGSRVEIAVEVRNEQCRIEVRDQGPGVKPEEREKIFQKFSRGSALPTQGEESIGLGLWIVRRFASALHGKVWCEPAPGGIGSSFIVEVPRLPPTA